MAITNAMPRTTEATTTTVYATNERGSVCQRCIRCGSWAPIWSPDGDNKIKIGMLIRMRNPKEGMRMANGQTDERRLLMFPKVKTGHGCPSCVEEYTTLIRRNTRNPYIEVQSV